MLAEIYNRFGEEQYYTVELTNAQIGSISHHSGSTDELMAIPPYETLTIHYQSITWTWEPTGASSNDTWQTP